MLKLCGLIRDCRSLIIGEIRAIEEKKLPVASIGSTTNTRDPSGNFSGKLQFIKRKLYHRLQLTSSFGNNTCDRYVRRNEHSKWCLVLAVIIKLHGIKERSNNVDWNSANSEACYKVKLAHRLVVW